MTDRRDRDWLTRFINTPNEMRSAGDPAALALRAKYQVQMPNLLLTDEEVRAVIGYVAEQSRALAHMETTAAASPKLRGVEPDVGPVLTAYLTIQRALAADSLAGVKARARDIASEAARGGPIDEPVAAAARTFERTTDLSSARAAFGQLSDAMLVAAKRSAHQLADGLRVAYCPMARKYWLQTGDSIDNPYYGATMRACGRFEPGIPDPE